VAGSPTGGPATVASGPSRVVPRMTRDGSVPDHDQPDPRDPDDDEVDRPDPRDPDDDEVDQLDPDAPGRWLFEDADEVDAPEPNEPG
jgi:hypothetical protein